MPGFIVNRITIACTPDAFNSKKTETLYFSFWAYLEILHRNPDTPDRVRHKGSEVEIWKLPSAPIPLKRFLCVVYANAGTKSIKYSFRREAELLLLSGRLDWTQTKVKHWKIRKYIRKKIWKMVILLGSPNKMRRFCR